MQGESELYNLNVFDWAQIDPKQPIETQAADNSSGQVHQSDDVLVKVHESKRNSIVYGFGFEVINRGGSLPSGTVAVPGIPPVGLPQGFKTSEATFWGPRGTFEYTRRNVRGRAESYTVAALAGRLDQRFGFTYTDPYFRGTSWRGSALFSVEHNAENPIFTARLGNLGYQLQKALDAKKTRNLFLRYNFQVTRISNLLIPDLVPPNQLNVRLSTVSVSYIRDTRDNILDAHRGWYQSAEIDVNPAFLGSNFSFTRFLGQIAHYRNVGRGIVWANSVRVGLEQSFSGSVVPISQEFFSGGGSTLRGFPLNGAGPQRTVVACGNPNDPSTCSKITVPDGGPELLILNSELRFPLNMIKQNLGLVTFYDGGNVFSTVGFHNFTALYTNSVGLGLRYATPVGPIRIDVGHNLNPVPGIKSTQYFITIGQAF
jgi:outer membrane protein assembly factor BamA